MRPKRLILAKLQAARRAREFEAARMRELDKRDGMPVPWRVACQSLMGQCSAKDSITQGAIANSSNWQGSNVGDVTRITSRPSMASSLTRSSTTYLSMLRSKTSQISSAPGKSRGAEDFVYGLVYGEGNESKAEAEFIGFGTSRMSANDTSSSYITPIRCPIPAPKKVSEIRAPETFDDLEWERHEAFFLQAIAAMENDGIACSPSHGNKPSFYAPTKPHTGPSLGFRQSQFTPRRPSTRGQNTSDQNKELHKLACRYRYGGRPPFTASRQQEQQQGPLETRWPLAAAGDRAATVPAVPWPMDAKGPESPSSRRKGRRGCRQATGRRLLVSAPSRRVSYWEDERFKLKKRLQRKQLYESFSRRVYGRCENIRSNQVCTDNCDRRIKVD
ncbi:unnamed protein product [Chrysoparadoxa australica]